jgi:sulfocyanin SoxE-like protein
MSVRHVAVCTFAAFAIAPPAALGGGPEPPVKLRMSEYRIRLDRGHASAGYFRMDLRNTGKVQHDLVVIKTARTAKKLPVVNGQVVRHGFKAEVPLEPGEFHRIVFGKLRAGHYVLICEIPGHYQKGMRRDFTVRLR